MLKCVLPIIRNNVCPENQWKGSNLENEELRRLPLFVRVMDTLHINISDKFNVDQTMTPTTRSRSPLISIWWTLLIWYILQSVRTSLSDELFVNYACLAIKLQKWKQWKNAIRFTGKVLECWSCLTGGILEEYM